MFFFFLEIPRNLGSNCKAKGDKRNPKRDHKIVNGDNVFCGKESASGLGLF